MAKQVQASVSSMLKEFGGQLSGANAEFKDKPVDTGNLNLPPGIKFGIAKLQSIGWYVEENDNAKTPKGKNKCEAVAICVYPLAHDGVKCEGLRTTQVIPLCDLPKQAYHKEEPNFKFHLGKFVNLLKQVSNNTMVCQETNQSDPTGQKTLQYWFGCMTALSDPKRVTYITFSTSSFTPPARKPIGWKQGDLLPEPTPLTIHKWHEWISPEEVAKYVGQHNPANGVTVAGNTDMSPTAFEEPPQGVVDPKSIPSTNGDGSDDTPEFANLEEEVTFLTEVAMDESNEDSEAVQLARERLVELAVANGWTQEEAESSEKTWDDVAHMALNAPEPEADNNTPTVGSKWKYVRRDQNTGAKMKDRDKKELPPLTVEVAKVNLKNKTCNVVNTKDNRTVTDVRTRKTVDVKWEWLEPLK